MKILIKIEINFVKLYKKIKNYLKFALCKIFIIFIFCISLYINNNKK